MKSLAVRVLSDFGVDELAYLDAIAARAAGGSVEVAVVDGEAGIGKTTLLRAWAGRREAGGDTVLMASCGPLDRSLPLDALAAEDAATRARCLAIGGRTRHAAGDLARAELLLGEAFSLAEGADRVAAAAWLGVLRAHQSRAEEALALLRPAGRGQIGAEHTRATLHSLLFTGHAHALAGRPAQALDAFTRYTAEVERRQVPRFAGRAVNFAGWVLRNLGAGPEALDHHREALEVGQGQGTADVTIAALEDLAEQCLDASDADGAAARLAQAGALLHGDLVFGWRLRLKHRFVTARLALHVGDAERALAGATELAAEAAALGVPRYTSVARLLGHRANHALGVPLDPGAVAADLDLLDRCVAIEAWRWTCDVATDFGQPAWLDRAADRAARLARSAGDHADGLLREADRRLARRRAPAG